MSRKVLVVDDAQPIRQHLDIDAGGTEPERDREVDVEPANRRKRFLLDRSRGRSAGQHRRVSALIGTAAPVCTGGLLAKQAIDAGPPDTEAARRVPTKGPTHAKDANENVRPMSSEPTNPPWSAP